MSIPFVTPRFVTPRASDLNTHQLPLLKKYSPKPSPYHLGPLLTLLLAACGHSHNHDNSPATTGASVRPTTPSSSAYSNRINGDDKANSLTGTAAKDEIWGYGGNDTLSGAANDDALNGGAGDDTLTGGAGTDRLTGGTGNDVFVLGTPVATEAGADVITDFTRGDKLTLPAGVSAVYFQQKGEDSWLVTTDATPRYYAKLEGFSGVLTAADFTQKGCQYHG